MHKASRAVGDAGRGRESVLITAKNLAQMMQISVRTLWRLMSAGEIVKPVRIDGNTRWRLDEVEQWIADGCSPPSDIEK